MLEQPSEQKSQASEPRISFDDAIKAFEQIREQPNMKPEDIARVDAAIADLREQKDKKEKSVTERGQA